MSPGMSDTSCDVAWDGFCGNSSMSRFKVWETSVNRFKYQLRSYGVPESLSTMSCVLPPVSLLSLLTMGFKICGGASVCGAKATAEEDNTSNWAIAAAAWIHIHTYSASLSAMGMVLIPKKLVAANTV